MKIAIPWQASRQIRFGSRLAVVAMATAFLLTAGNAFATTLGPTNVLTISGGWINNGLSGPYYGYGDDTTSAGASFNFPAGMALDPSDASLFIADCTNNAVRWYSNPNSPGSGIQVYTFANITNGVSRPVAVAVDLSDNVFVLNRARGTNGYVLEFTNNAEFFDYPVFGPLLAYPAVTNNTFPLTNATAMVYDGKTNIYVVCNSNTVVRVTIGGVSTVIASGTNSFGAIGTNVNLRGVTLMTNGWLALSDAGNNGIWTMNPTNNAVASQLTGFHGAGDVVGPKAFVAFNNPENIGAAGNGRLVVADRYNHKVKIIDPSGNVSRLFGVSSDKWWTGTDPLGHQALPGISDGLVDPIATDTGAVQAREPFGLVVAPDGSVYDTEVYYHVIRHITSTGLPQPIPWPPLPPAGPSVTVGYGYVFLTWTGSANATNYNVKRSFFTGGPYTTIASTTNTTYTDTNVLDGTTYYYVVSGLNTGGEGPNSAEVSAMPLFSPAPINLTVTAAIFGKISLAWSPSAGATSYNVKRSTSTNTETTIASTASTTYNDTAVTNGETYYYVVSAVNLGGENPTNSNEVSVTAPTPPPPAPTIGWFDYEGIAPPVTVFHPVSGNAYTNHNDLMLAIVQNDNSGISTYYTDDGSTPSSGNGSTPPVYINGTPNFVQPLVVTPAPDLVIKAINFGPGGSSPIVTAEFVFQVGNPNVVGNNAAQFGVSNVTVGAQMYYTTDGSDPNPTNAAATGPVLSGAILSLQFPANTNVLQFKIRGFKTDYLPSAIVINVFSKTNFVANTISFGFTPNDPVAQGEASSVFVASPGQTFFAPVTLLPLSGVTIYSMAFNLTVTNAGPNPGPAITPGAFAFTSMLRKPDPANPGYYLQIPPYMFINTNSTTITNTVFYDGSTNFVSLLVTNLSENLLGVGWLERATKTNLYDTTSQDLIQYSQAHDTLFLQGNGRVILGGYSFQVPYVPGVTTNGQTYQIQIGRPSASSDGVGGPGSSVFISAPTNGSLGEGSINSIKNVTLGQFKYIAGDAYPFRWFNAGDFGDTNLDVNDVQQVFNSAVYDLNSPVWQAPGSDFADSMNSCGAFGVTNPGTGYFTKAGPLTVAQQNALFNADYTTMDQIAFGDTNVFGVPNLDVCDVYVTYVRYLDPQRTWYRRFWTNGVLVAEITPNVFNPSAVKQSSGGKFLPAVNPNDPAPVSITNTPSVNFVAGDITNASAGHVVSIPVTASVFGPYPLRVLMLNISVVPLDGSPGLTTPISFTLNPPFNNASAYNPAASGLQSSSGNNNYSVALLPVQFPIPQTLGVSNNAVIGTLNITIPATATSSSAYAIHFDHASGSPNGVGSFSKHTLTGLITLSSRASSHYNDGIPDSWRLRWFGTINNLLSVSNACPSGDGINNWKKYVAGVDPSTPNDFPSLNPNTPPPSGAAMSIYWPTVSGKHYAILSSASLFPGNWITNATITGTGANMEFDDNSTGPVKFYRVLILP